jgi:hypothetical protein
MSGGGSGTGGMGSGNLLWSASDAGDALMESSSLLDLAQLEDLDQFTFEASLGFGGDPGLPPTPPSAAVATTTATTSSSTTTAAQPPGFFPQQPNATSAPANNYGNFGFPPAAPQSQQPHGMQDQSMAQQAPFAMED